MIVWFEFFSSSSKLEVVQGSERGCADDEISTRHRVETWASKRGLR